MAVSRDSLSRPFEDLLITEVGDGPFFVEDLFQRKFAQVPPGYGNPVICFYRKAWDHFVPVCYTNFLLHDEVILVGGAMTDGGAFHHMPEELRESIRESHGIYYHLLKFAFDHFRDRCDAYFGYAGDKRAYAVDIHAGFAATQYPYLIAHFHKPLSTEAKEMLINKIHALGPF